MNKQIVMSLDRALQIKKSILDKKKLEQTAGLKGPRLEDPLVNFCAGLTERWCQGTTRSYITRDDIERLLPVYLNQWAKTRKNQFDYENTWWKQRETVKQLLKYHKELGCPL